MHAMQFRQLNNMLYRKFPGNTYSNVNVFFKKDELNNKSKHFLSLPIKSDVESVLICSINDYATSCIMETFPGCEIQEEPLHSAKYISRSLMIPIVVIINCFCSLHDKKEVIEVYYCSSPKMASSEFIPFLPKIE